MEYWAKPPMDRKQLPLFSPTLDDTISDDDTVRVLDEILQAMDWTDWECRYHGRHGQPPIHPRWLAGSILYGLMVSVRSSRRLEYSCRRNMDFIWISSGFQPDHSTFAEFRANFGKELKGLFKQIGRLAMAMGLIRLGEVGLDGTRVRANSSRHSTAKAETIEKRLEALAQRIDELFAQAQQEDIRDRDLYGSAGPMELPAELRDLKRRQARLTQALANAREVDARRAARKDGPKEPAAVAVTDPDSAVLPNKEGGHAPNYTPMAAVDGQSGFIVDCDVHAEANEGHTTVETVDRIEETFGQKPEKFLADSAHGKGENLEAMDARGVDAYIPPDCLYTGPNPAVRDDPTSAVPADQWADLPRNKQTKKLDKAAFVYVSAEDCYYCPMGHRTGFADQFQQDRQGEPVTVRRYRCQSCAGCPLKHACTDGQSRTVRRDQHEQRRVAMAAKLATEAGKQTYSRRMWICETAFGWLKGSGGLRQFLLRGMDKVRTEWRWLCTASNLRKLVCRVRRARGYLTELAV